VINLGLVASTDHFPLSSSCLDTCRLDLPPSALEAFCSPFLTPRLFVKCSLVSLFVCGSVVSIHYSVCLAFLSSFILRRSKATKLGTATHREDGEGFCTEFDCERHARTSDHRSCVFRGNRFVVVAGLCCVYSETSAGRSGRPADARCYSVVVPFEKWLLCRCDVVSDC